MSNKELLEILDPSLICFADKLMAAAKEGYELDVENYPQLFGGLYHCKVARVNKPSIIETLDKAVELAEDLNKQAKEVGEIVTKAQRGPKPKKAVE
jgi:hypothetical protein